MTRSTPEKRFASIHVLGLTVAGILGASLISLASPSVPADRSSEELCVLPIKSTPDPKILSAMKIVFGNRLTLSRECTAPKVYVLRGTQAAVDQAARALGEFVDRKRAKQDIQHPGRRAEQVGKERVAAGPAIELVRLRRTDCKTIIQLAREIVSDNLELTERPKSRTLIVEGDHQLVRQAVWLAQQLDGQRVHRSVRGLIGGWELEWDDD